MSSDEAKNMISNLYSANSLIEYSTNNPDKLIVIYFTASWCGPCKEIKPFILEKISTNENVSFSIIDVDNDNYEDLCEDYSVNAMPTFLFFKNKQVVEKIVGGNKEKIEQLINDNK